MNKYTEDLFNKAKILSVKMHLTQTTHALMGVSVILCCLILWNGWSLYDGQALFSTSISQAFNEREIEDHLPSSLNSPFFGQYKPTLLDQSIEHSQLADVVVGIMFSKVSNLSQVVIRNEQGVERVYRVGEPLRPGITIEAIEPFHIVVSNQGRLERLSLHKNDLRFEPSPQPLIMKE